MGAVKSLIKGVMGDIDPRYDPRKASIERNAQLTPTVESRGTLDNVPRVSLSSLEGTPFVTTMSDRTRAGGLLTDINGVRLDDPVNLQGGQDFMFENPGMVWASAPTVVKQMMLLAKEQGVDPLYLPYRMAPTGGDFAKKTGETMIKYASANMTPQNKKALDKAIKEYVTVGTVKNGKRKGHGKSIKGWKGIDSPESIEVWRNTPDSVRKELMNKVFDVKFRDRGGLSIGEARLAVSDPTQVGARDAGVQNVGRIWTKDDIVQESGHPSYPAGLPGEGIGRLDQQDLTVFDLLPDARLGKKQLRVGDNVDPLDPSARSIRALSMKPYAGVIDENILRKLEDRGVNVNSAPWLAPLALGMLSLAQSEDAEAGFTTEMLKNLAKKSGDTQVATTGGSYRKAGDILKREGISDNVLDYGAGRGHGTQYLPGNAKSYEPNPMEGYTPDFTESPDEMYDGIANLNVLNVVPEPIRQEIAADILGKLNKDGVAAIGARSYSDVMNAKNPQVLDDGGIITQKGTYQYGFGGENEGLIDYLLRQAEQFPDREYEIKKEPLAATGALVRRIKGVAPPVATAGLLAAGQSEDADAIAAMRDEVIDSLLSYSDDRAKKDADRRIPDARTIDEQRIANHRREVNERMHELGLLEDPLYKYRDIAPFKENIVTGERSPALPSSVRGMIRAILDLGSSPRTGVYNPEAAIDII